MTHTWEALVRTLRDYVRWPKLGPDERIDVEARRSTSMWNERDEVVFSAYRYSTTDPHRYHREVHEALPGDVIRRFERTGYKEPLVRECIRVMQRLALILSAKPPKGWRLYGRAKEPMTRWSRLMTRPLRVTYADKETRNG
jgi:hypothetical protein